MGYPERTRVRTRRINTLRSQHLNRLYGGISQQSSLLRLEHQHEGQINAYNSIVRNFDKRPPTHLVKKLISGLGASITGGDVYAHEIKRDATEKYIVLFTPDATEPILIFALDGTKMTVNYDTAGDRTYCINQPLTTSNRIRAVTISDYTIIANAGTLPAMTSNLTATQDPFAYIWVKKTGPNLGASSIRIDLDIDGTTSNNTYAQPNTNEVLSAAITNWTAAFPLFTFTKVGTANDSNVVKIKKTAGGSFQLRLNDGQGGNGVSVIKGSVNALSELPPVGIDGDIVKVIGEKGETIPGFYLKFEDDTQKWIESTAENIKFELDNTTMPRQMVRSTGSTFDVSKITWDDRLVGDDDSAPEPSFIGNGINDVFFHKNRLGFLASESVIMSKSGDFFDFFPTTASEVLDDDPIDVPQPIEKVAILRDALTFGERLFILSDEHQFLSNVGGSILSPNTFSLNEATAFRFSDKAQAIRAGANAYFVVEDTDFSTIREYFVEPDTLLNDATDITGHVPRYLPKNIKSLSANTAEGIVAVSSYDEGHKSRLYIYQYFWQEQTKVLSSWNYWEFGEFREILASLFFNDELYLIFRDLNNDTTSDLVMEKIPLKQEKTGVFDVLLHGDRFIDPAIHTVSAVVSGTAPDLSTTITLPVNDNYSRVPTEDDTDWIAIHKTTGSFLQGTRDTATGNDDEVVFQKDISTTKDDYYYMKFFEFETELTEFHLRNSQGEARTLDQIILRTLEVIFKKTGAFRLQVTPENQSTSEEPYSGAIVGVVSLDNPFSVVADGSHRFFIGSLSKGLSIKIYSKSIHPFSIDGLKYEYTPISRSR